MPAPEPPHSGAPVQTCAISPVLFKPPGGFGKSEFALRQGPGKIDIRRGSHSALRSRSLARNDRKNDAGNVISYRPCEPDHAHAAAGPRARPRMRPVLAWLFGILLLGGAVAAGTAARAQTSTHPGQIATARRDMVVADRPPVPPRQATSRAAGRALRSFFRWSSLPAYPPNEQRQLPSRSARH